MAHLVVGDVMNVLREIGIDSSQSMGIDSIAASFRNFGVPVSAQFVILRVKISLEGFPRSQELQDGNIACGEATTGTCLLCIRLRDSSEQACSHGYCPGGHQSAFQKAAPILYHHFFRRFDLTHFESPLLSNIGLAPPPESSIIWL